MDLSQRIVGGHIAQSPIPWQVHIQYESEGICGGSILDEETILTSAHCIVKYFSNPIQLLDANRQDHKYQI